MLELVKLHVKYDDDHYVRRSKFYIEMAKIHSKLGNNEDADKCLRLAYGSLKNKPKFKDILQPENTDESFSCKCDKIDEIFVAEYKELKRINNISHETDARDEMTLDYLFPEESLESEHLVFKKPKKQ